MSATIQKLPKIQLTGLLIAAALALLIALASPVLSLSLLIGSGALLAILIRPWLGLPLLALAVPFAALKPLPLGGAALDGTDLLVALLVVVWLARGVIERRIHLPWPPLALPILLFLGALCLSLPGALSFSEGLPELLKWAEFAALYWCLVAILPARHSGWLLAGILLAGAAQAMLGIAQFLTQTGPEPFIILGRFMRAFGSFRQPNPYAGYLGLIAPLALSLSIWAWLPDQTLPAGKRRLALRLLLPALAAIISLGLLVSWSRGAWLAFAAAAAVVILALSRKKAPAVLLLAGLALLIFLGLGLADLLPASLLERLGVDMIDVRHIEVTDANFAVVERVAHWKAAVAMWADRPWFGQGIGNYAAVYDRYALPRWQEALGHAHNVYLNFGAETGLIGLLAYLGLGLAAGWQALRAAASPNRLIAATGAGVLGVLTHATIHNLFDNLWVQHIYLHLALLLGLLAVMRDEKSADLIQKTDLRMTHHALNIHVN